MNVEYQQEPRQDIMQYQSSNEHVLKDHTFMQLRLDPSSLIKDIEILLGNKIVKTYRDEQGLPHQVLESVGQPLANEQGIREIIL